MENAILLEKFINNIKNEQVIFLISILFGLISIVVLLIYYDRKVKLQ